MDDNGNHYDMVMTIAYHILVDNNMMENDDDDDDDGDDDRIAR